MVSPGTPLSPSATRIMLLGSGELAEEVLIALQRLGVETIAVDRYDDAPGHQVAHHCRMGVALARAEDGDAEAARAVAREAAACVRPRAVRRARRGPPAIPVRRAAAPWRRWSLRRPGARRR
jgi:phosphoribosylglycinamide formyltransferase 2